jgi:hypothetical protein
MAAFDLDTTSRPSSLCIFGWLTIQTGALVLSALRVRLWEHAPVAMEFLAMETLLVVQIIGAALLSPRLADGWRSTAIAGAGAWPFVILAGMLAAAPLGSILEAGAFVSVWLGVLWFGQYCCGNERQKWVLGALATTWAAAGPILVFIHAEYRPDTPQPPTAIPPAVSGPLMSAITLVSSTNSAEKWGCWVCLVAAALAGGVIFAVQQIILLRPFTNHQTSR